MCRRWRRKRGHYFAGCAIWFSLLTHSTFHPHCTWTLNQNVISVYDCNSTCTGPFTIDELFDTLLSFSVHSVLASLFSRRVAIRDVAMKKVKRGKPREESPSARNCQIHCRTKTEPSSVSFVAVRTRNSLWSSLLREHTTSGRFTDRIESHQGKGAGEETVGLSSEELQGLVQDNKC